MTILSSGSARTLSRTFLALSALGIALALYHAWSERAFVTNPFLVNYAPYASFFGVPYWLFGVVWFPLVLIIGLWTTRLGKTDLDIKLFILLAIGNVFTGYLWYLDIVIIKALTLQYILLYSTNYALTGLVVYQNRKNDLMHGFAWGTLLGAVVGLLFGPYGVAACGIAGGVFGVIRNYAMPKKTVTREVSRAASPETNMDLQEIKKMMTRQKIAQCAIVNGKLSYIKEDGEVHVASSDNS